MCKRGRWRKIIQRIVVQAVFGIGILCMTGCSALSANKTYVVMLGDKEIKTGETKIQELADLGYEICELSPTKMVTNSIDKNDIDIEFVYDVGYEMTIETEPNTYYLSNSLVKDGNRIAGISIVNETEKTLPLGECKVETITFYTDDLITEDVFIEGIAFSEISKDAVISILGEPSYISKESDIYKWERGYSRLELQYDENGVLKIVVIS